MELFMRLIGFQFQLVLRLLVLLDYTRFHITCTLASSCLELQHQLSHGQKTKQFQKAPNTQNFE